MEGLLQVFEQLLIGESSADANFDMQTTCRSAARSTVAPGAQVIRYKDHRQSIGMPGNQACTMFGALATMIRYKTLLFVRSLQCLRHLLVHECLTLAPGSHRTATRNPYDRGQDHHHVQRHEDETVVDNLAFHWITAFGTLPGSEHTSLH